MKKILFAISTLLLMQIPFGCNKSNDSFEKKINSVQSEFEMAINKAIQQKIENENPAQIVRDNLAKTKSQIEQLRGQAGKSTFKSQIDKIIIEAKRNIPNDLIVSPISHLEDIKQLDNPNEQANELSLISDEIDEIENSTELKTKTEIIAKNFLKKNINLLDGENIFKSVIDSNKNKEKILSTTTSEFTDYLEKNINKASDLTEQSKKLFNPDELPKVNDAVKKINESFQDLKTVFKKDVPLKDLSEDDKKKTEEKLLKIKDETEKYAKQLANQIKKDEEKLKNTTDPKERENLEKKIQFEKILLTILGVILFAVGVYLMATGNVAGGLAAVTLAISLLTGGSFNSGGGGDSGYKGYEEGGQRETSGSAGTGTENDNTENTKAITDSFSANRKNTSGTGDSTESGTGSSLIQEIISQDSSYATDENPKSSKKIKMLHGEDWNVKFDFQVYWDFTYIKTNEIFKVEIPENYRVICGANYKNGFAYGILDNGIAFNSKLSKGTGDKAYKGCSFQTIKSLNGCTSDDKTCCEEYAKKSKSGSGDSDTETANELFGFGTSDTPEGDIPLDTADEINPENKKVKKGKIKAFSYIKAHDNLTSTERQKIKTQKEIDENDKPEETELDLYFSPGSDNKPYVLGVAPKNSKVAFIVYLDNKAKYFTPSDFKVNDVIEGKILDTKPKLNRICVIEIGSESFITGTDVTGRLYKIPIYPIDKADYIEINAKLSSKEPCK